MKITEEFLEALRLELAQKDFTPINRTEAEALYNYIQELQIEMETMADRGIAGRNARATYRIKHR